MTKFFHFGTQFAKVLFVMFKVSFQKSGLNAIVDLLHDLSLCSFSVAQQNEIKIGNVEKSEHQPGNKRKCQFGLFTCADGSCVPQTFICDGQNDCPNKEDEKNCKCDKTDLNIMALTCFVDHHKREMTEMSLANSASETVGCRPGSEFDHTILTTKWCIYEKSTLNRAPLYCPHADHLKNCTNFICDSHFKCPASYCVSYSNLCDKTWDCPRGEDETQNVCFSCLGAFRCKSQRHCVPMSIVCDTVAQCPIGDDEIPCIFGKIICPANCTCMLHSVICSKTDISKIVVFSVWYQDKLNFLFLNESQINLNAMTFLNLPNLLYLNISSSNISDLCAGESYFVYLKKLQTLDLSKNSISVIHKQCIKGPLFLSNLVIRDNPLAHLESFSFFNLLNVSTLCLNDMKIEHIGDFFFSSEKENMLKHLDISNNMLTYISPGIVGNLTNLKVFVVFGNNLLQLVFQLPNNVNLQELIVDHVLQCKNKNTQQCKVFEDSQYASLKFNAISPVSNVVLFVLVAPVLLLCVLTLPFGFYIKVFPENYVNFIKFLNDLLIAVFWLSFTIFIHTNRQLAVKVFLLYYILGVASIATFLFDMFLKFFDSFNILTATRTSTKMKRRILWTMPRSVLCSLLFSLLISFVTIEYSQLRKQLELSSRILEAVIYAIPFTMPSLSTHILSICSITLFLLGFNTITTISIASIKNQMQTVLQMSPMTDVSNRVKLVKRLYGNLVITNISYGVLLPLSIAMLFTSNFLVSVLMLVGILLKMLLNSIMFLVLNKKMGETIKEAFKAMFCGGCKIKTDTH